MKKWRISVIARDDGWRESHGVEAAFNIETETKWLPLRADAKMGQFFPNVLLRLNIGNDDGQSFIFVPDLKLAAITRSMQQIADLDPGEFNSSSKAVSMAKTALLINRKDYDQ